MPLPNNVGYGKVTGRFTLIVPDTPDTDSYPNSDPATGTVTFTAKPPYLLDPGAVPPVTLIPTPMVARLDANGDLIDAQGNVGIYLVATNDPSLNPTGWTYTAKLATTGTIIVREFSFPLPVDSEVDLTTVLEVPSDLGTPIAQGPRGPVGPAGADSTVPGPAGPVGPPGPAGPAGSATTSQPVVGAVLGFPGAPDTTTKATTPWPAGWVPGDLDIRALVAPRAWVSAAAQSIASVFDPAVSPTLHSFAFQIIASGKLQMNVSLDGAAMILGTSTVNVPGALDGKPLWIRATHTANTGTRNFYTSPDGVTWTLFDTKAATPGVPKPSTRPVYVGMRDAGAGTPLNFGGLIYAVEIRDGIGGAIKAGIDTRGRWTGIGVAGNVWTIAGNPYWYPLPQAAL